MERTDGPLGRRAVWVLVGGPRTRMLGDETPAEWMRKPRAAAWPRSKRVADVR